MNALIVDDSRPVRDMARKALERAGYIVDTAVSGAGALLLVELRAELGTAFDVIVCDYSMPGISGIDVYDQLTTQQQSIFLLHTSEPACYLPERSGLRVVHKSGAASLVAAVKELRCHQPT